MKQLNAATAYENAGADAILIHSKKNTPQMKFLNFVIHGKEIFH